MADTNSISKTRGNLDADIKIYVRDIGKVPHLTPEEEIALAA
jgi:hypothetical protein